jgi:hypothetical protein
MNATKNRIARWVSVIAHPFVMIAVVVCATTARTGSLSEVAINVGVVTFFVIFPIAVLMTNRVRRRAWENVDASKPEERPLRYVVGILGILLLVCFLAASGSPLFRGAAVTLVMLLFCAGMSRWIKVSLHVTAAALVATTLLLFGSPLGWIVLCVIPLLCWSRFALRRHSLTEIAVGFGYGVIGGVAIHFP